MMKLIYAVLIVTVAVFGLTFSYKNPQTVEVHYYFGLDFAGPLPLLLLATFAVGLLLGYFIAVLRRLTRRKPKATSPNTPLNYEH